MSQVTNPGKLYGSVISCKEFMQWDIGNYINLHDNTDKLLKKMASKIDKKEQRMTSNAPRKSHRNKLKCRKPTTHSLHAISDTPKFKDFIKDMEERLVDMTMTTNSNRHS